MRTIARRTEGSTRLDRAGAEQVNEVERVGAPLPVDARPGLYGPSREDRKQPGQPRVAETPHPDAAALINQARQRTKLDDFGDPPIEPALSVLTRSLADEANLHTLGRFLAGMHLQDLLETRLRLVEAWRHTKMVLPEVRAPVFITGMPRSGSTFLHELLSLDEAHRVPRVWEVMYPLPPVGSVFGNETARVWRTEVNLWWFRRLARQADAVYPMRARTPHECVAIHSYTLLSQEFVSSFHVPTYEAFLDASDLSVTYRWQKRFLEHLQAGRPPQRWVLKSPDHVRSLEALRNVFPDALIVQTHRHPVESLISSSHLTEVLRGMFSRPQTRRDIGRREVSVLADNINRMLRFRDGHPEWSDRFLDVQYRELVEDPLTVVKRIYDRLGASLSDEAARRMRDFSTRRGRYSSPGNGRPTLEELNLDVTVETERFEPYCERFGIDHFRA